MKCVKHKKTSKIVRVTDERARQMVGGGEWTYARKEEWKKGGRKYE